MQRTRCTYFRDVTAACNKRVPGSGCAALQGFNRSHAILGALGPVRRDAPLGRRRRVRRAGGDRAPAGPGRRAPRPLRRLPPASPAHTPDREQAIAARRADHRGGDPGSSTPAAVGLSQGARPAELRVRPDLRGGRAARPGRRDPHGEGRRRRRGHRAVEAARCRAAPASASDLRRRCGPRRRNARPRTRTRCEHNGFKVELLKRTVERQLRIVGGAQ